MNASVLLNTFDFYVLPVFNVDGYVYTFENVNKIKIILNITLILWKFFL